jgi:hypothetical protein
MITVSSLLDAAWLERYRRIASLNFRSSIYDVTNRCNLRCQGCFFFSSGEHQAAEQEPDTSRWEAFVEAEKARGVTLAILIGGEPTLYLDRVAAFYGRLPTFCATNGQLKVPRDRFPDMMLGISLWGTTEDELELRGKDTFRVSAANYQGDAYVYYLLTITPRQLGRVEDRVRQIRDAGLRVHFQLLSNDEAAEGFVWTNERLRDVHAEMDGLLSRYPETVISCPYYHQVLTTGTMLGRRFGWDECPSISETFDDRPRETKRLIRFRRWASDLATTHRCCTSASRDCRTCKDGAAHMSWVMVNKRAHMRSTRDFHNWIETYEMFAKLYRFIPW